MIAVAAVAAQNRDVVGTVQALGQFVQGCLGRHCHPAYRGLPAHTLDGRVGQRNIARQHDDRYRAIDDGAVHGGLENLRQLGRVADQLAVVTALGEQVLRMCFLKITQPDFRGRNLSCDSHHGHVGPLGFEQAVDQVQVARAAGAGTDR